MRLNPLVQRTSYFVDLVIHKPIFHRNSSSLQFCGAFALQSIKVRGKWYPAFELSEVSQ